MAREREVMLHRTDDGWYATVRGELVALELPPTAYIIEAVALARARFEFDRLGIPARDIGPAAQQLGEVVWLRR